MTQNTKMEIALFAINWLSGIAMGLTIAQMLR